MKRLGKLIAAENLALAAFGLFTLFAVLGYWNFGLHPERLPQEPWAIRIYQVSFPWFARGQILFSALALFVALFRFAGLRWLAPLIAVCSLAFMAEHIGTGYGIPFSGYSYSGLLGPKFLGRVPWLIPLSWFLMSAPAWVIAKRTFRHRSLAIAFAAALLVLWDLALDPAMSFLTPYWIWENPGSFYGMPWINLAGWFGTGLVLMTALSLLDDRSNWSKDIPTAWSLTYYLVVLAMPLGMVTAAGLWGSTGATVAALLAAAALVRFVPQTRLGPASPSEDRDQVGLGRPTRPTVASAAGGA